MLDDTFVVPRDSKEHFLRIKKGYGFNKELVLDLIEMKIAYVRVVIDGGKVILLTHPKSIVLKGEHFQADGFEPQWVLPEDKFEKRFESVI